VHLPILLRQQAHLLLQLLLGNLLRLGSLVWLDNLLIDSLPSLGTALPGMDLPLPSLPHGLPSQHRLPSAAGTGWSRLRSSRRCSYGVPLMLSHEGLSLLLECCQHMCLWLLMLAKQT